MINLFGCLVFPVSSLIFFILSQKTKPRCDSDESDHMEGRKTEKIRGKGKRHDDSDDSDAITQKSKVSSGLPHCDKRNVSTSYILWFPLHRGKNRLENHGVKMIPMTLLESPNLM